VPDGPTRATADAPVESALKVATSRQGENLTRLAEFVSIPSISANPENAADCRRAAEWLLGELRRVGSADAELHETDHHPIVTGSVQGAPGAPTVLVYGHYDVQPASAADPWSFPPFEPAILVDRITGRGSADDKGQLFAYFAAVEAIQATQGELPVTIEFVVDGDEEFESIHLDTWLEKNRDRYSPDVIMISDTWFMTGNKPAIPVSLRGITCFQVDLVGPNQDLHSGVFGGPVVNPANALCEIIAGLKDADGRVTVPGFYDGMRQIDQAERDYIASIPFDDAAWRDSIGVSTSAGEKGWTIPELLTSRPTLDVNGMWSGFTGDGVSTIIPATAHAKLSSRLIDGQIPSQVFARIKEHILSVAPDGVEVTVTAQADDATFWIDRDDPFISAAQTSIAWAFGERTYLPRAGSSIPVAACLELLYARPIVLFGFASPDCGAHALDEHMLIANYANGVAALIDYLHQVARLIPPPQHVPN
jgi:acetylornithine deacetylase/succinyl-diaminopimelate desuccinylase-like protein